MGVNNGMETAFSGILSQDVILRNSVVIKEPLRVILHQLTEKNREVERKNVRRGDRKHDLREEHRPWKIACYLDTRITSPRSGGFSSPNS